MPRLRAEGLLQVRRRAELVAEHTFDASEYLMRIARGEGTVLDTEFPGEVPETITYHTPCHLRAQGIGGLGRAVNIRNAILV